MYKVLIKFADTLDSKHLYHAGDNYPREGYEPTNERISELSTDNNKLGKAVIEVVAEAVTEEQPKRRTKK